jgi:hypothetical protein
MWAYFILTYMFDTCILHEIYMEVGSCAVGGYLDIHVKQTRKTPQQSQQTRASLSRN